MRKIRVAEIGTSEFSHGNQIWQSINKQSELFEVVGFALPEGEREKYPEQMEAFEGYKELSIEDILSDGSIDAVFVETEEKYLTKYGRAVVEAGKHLHMEKPGGQELSEFEAMLGTAKEKNLVFHTGYMYRYNPAVKRLLSDIREGKLGEIISVESEMSCYHGKKMRQWLSGYRGGMTFFLGCHLLDLTYSIMGMPNKIIPMNRASGLDGASSLDQGLVLLDYDRGYSYLKTTAVHHGGPGRRYFNVIGTKGSAEIRPLEGYCTGSNLLYSELTYRFPEHGWAGVGETFRTEPFDRYDEMTASFAAYVRGERENPYTYERELELYKLIMRSI